MQGSGQKQQQDDGSNLIYWIWLSKIPGIGIKTGRALLERFGWDPKHIYEADEEEYRKIQDIGEIRAKNIARNKNLDFAKRTYDDCVGKHISIMTLQDPVYPKISKCLPDMPLYLYYKGTLVENLNGVAIVGARRCTAPGKEKAVKLAHQVAASGEAVISGLAKGIDSYAHTACLKAGGYTVAVLGNGLDIYYPNEHSLLQQRIEENGVLISEYEPGVLPQKCFFPRRNRLIAAFSREIYIIEAGYKSGALITGDYGRKYGRCVIDIACSA